MIDVRLVTSAQLDYPDPDLPIVADALVQAGARIDIADWRDPAIDWSSARVTLLRSPWDYVDTPDEFLAWVRRAGSATDLWNPPELVAWNVHKAYLLELERRGAPIVPTVLLLRGSAASLDGICDAQGWNAVVVKPAIGSGSLGSGRFDVGDPRGQLHLDALLTRADVLVQPFLPSVTTSGELSVVVVDGVVTHALHKQPQSGDYRVQEELGGSVTASAAPAGAQELATRVVGALPGPALYARIDLLRMGELWHVLEAEVTEPALWLDHAPPAATHRLVDALMARVA